MKRTQRTLWRHAHTHATLLQPYPVAHTGPDAGADRRADDLHAQRRAELVALVSTHHASSDDSCADDSDAVTDADYRCSIVCAPLASSHRPFVFRASTHSPLQAIRRYMGAHDADACADGRADACSHGRADACSHGHAHCKVSSARGRLMRARAGVDSGWGAVG
jgi:hypothetical protein